MNRALLIMAKRPAPGETKTRLIPALSPEQAAELYECFLRDTLDLARAVPMVARFIAYLPEDASGYFSNLAADFELIPQAGNNLGERLDHVLSSCLNRGFERVVAIGSDSPNLAPAFVSRAFELLDSADVVLGPCEDGGYYLIGLTRSQPRILREVQMSTPNVLRETLARAQHEGLRVALLPMWYDVDSVEDWQRLKSELGRERSERAGYTRRFVSGL